MVEVRICHQIRLSLCFTELTRLNVSHGNAKPEDLVAVFRDLDINKANLVARAFSYFALLAHLAEDLADEAVEAPVSL